MRKGNQERIKQGHQGAFISLMIKRLKKGLKENTKKDDNRVINRLAADYYIEDKDIIKELVELAIVQVARWIALNQTLTQRQRFDKISELYQRQVNLSHRTSQSIMLQQYSTPATISFLASLFVRSVKPSGEFFEPSAGNGLLTIAIPPEQVTVNEIDDLRNLNLTRQGFKKVLKQDATERINTSPDRFDGVLTNPPFGSTDPQQFQELKTNTLDHIMAIQALGKMKDYGHAAIIIGGHTRHDYRGRIQSGKNLKFYSYLHKYYHVLDSINIDGKKLYSRQGTGFDVRLILIDGRKVIPGGYPPLKSEKDEPVSTLDALYSRVSKYIKKDYQNDEEMEIAEAEALELELELLDFALNGLEGPGLEGPGLEGPGLEGPYYPASNARSLDVEVPDSMDYEIHQAVARIKQEVGDLDEYVTRKLDYPSKEAMYKALAAEQVDTVAMAIYNMEVRQEGIIIGDQTGIGKGRQAAAIIRYATKQGKKPIFLTEKPNLFSDLYRDLVDIGSAELKPFIVNAREAKTHIKDAAGKIVYRAEPAEKQKAIFQKYEDRQFNQSTLSEYDYIVATYSQFNREDMNPKKRFMQIMGIDNIMVLDEAHNSSGESNTGTFLQSVVQSARGTTFLSATFAKRPDNMPIYAMKTSISDANMSNEDLVEAIEKGGVALQEILASQLVYEGQMVRRQRTYEGIEVNYITLTDHREQHRATADRITDIIRDIIFFQQSYIEPVVDSLDDEAKETGEAVGGSKKMAGVDNPPFFSKIFNVINQLLFAIKAEAVADRAIERLKEGKKPVLAFASTMGAFLQSMIEENKELLDDAEINVDFAEVLRRGLDGVMRITVKDGFGEKTKKKIELSQLDLVGQQYHAKILNKINKASTGICISPIDILTKKITEAGYTYAEVTGRQYQVRLNDDFETGIVERRKKEAANDAFRKFNDNEVDCLLINQSGSTGASAHAIPTKKVPAAQVKQRVMIVLQAELDINTEVQKRGRINRTGQIMQPIYDYLISDIPAEKRLMMMLQKKLKSLDANTSSNQKNSEDLLSTDDFLNKYGDQVVVNYLIENPNINAAIGDPLKLAKDNDEEKEDGRRKSKSSEAHKVSGRIAILSVREQERFYTEVLENYKDMVSFLKMNGEYNLEVETMDLQAEMLDRTATIVGSSARSVFGSDTFEELCRVKVLRKPYKKKELKNMLADATKEKDAQQIQAEILEEFERHTHEKLEEAKRLINERHEKLIQEVPNKAKIKKIEDADARWAKIAQEQNQLKQKQQELIEKNTKSHEETAEYIRKMLTFFYPGRAVLVPGNEMGEKAIINAARGICLGINVDHNKPNPYAPSAITVKIAVANSIRMAALKCSGAQGDKLTQIKGATYEMSHSAAQTTLQDWDEISAKASADYEQRVIITGNILQGYLKYEVGGKLVSYTAADGSIKKGMLMNMSYDVNATKEKTVPLNKGLKILKSLMSGQVLDTSAAISFIRQGDDFKAVVPGSTTKGGHIFLDQDLIDLTLEGTFNKQGDKMTAMVALEDIDQFVDTLYKNHKPSIDVTEAQFEIIKDDIESYQARPDIKLPARQQATMTAEPEEDEDELEMIAEAEALELELKLLEIKIAA